MKILTYPKEEKLLRQPGVILQPTDITADFLSNLEKMKAILKMDGMGLAATQVGWSVQLFLLAQDENLKETPIQIFLNPTILETSKEKERDSEGCLSFPGLFLDIERPLRIKWQYHDMNFQTHVKESTGYYARAVLHEISHLNGKLMIDGISTIQGLKFNRWLRGKR